jgi:DNA repair exonuclease SbcCD ATPase subunit
MEFFAKADLFSPGNFVLFAVGFWSSLGQWGCEFCRDHPYICAAASAAAGIAVGIAVVVVTKNPNAGFGVGVAVGGMCLAGCAYAASCCNKEPMPSNGNPGDSPQVIQLQNEKEAAERAAQKAREETEQLRKQLEQERQEMLKRLEEEQKRLKMEQERLEMEAKRKVEEERLAEIKRQEELRKQQEEDRKRQEEELKRRKEEEEKHGEEERLRVKHSQLVFRWVNGEKRSVKVADYVEKNPKGQSEITADTYDEFASRLGAALDKFLDDESRRNPNGTRDVILLKKPFAGDTNIDLIKQTVKERSAAKGRKAEYQYWSDTMKDLPVLLPVLLP